MKQSRWMIDGVFLQIDFGYINKKLRMKAKKVIKYKQSFVIQRLRSKWTLQSDDISCTDAVNGFNLDIVLPGL